MILCEAGKAGYRSLASLKCCGGSRCHTFCAALRKQPRVCNDLLRFCTCVLLQKQPGVCNYLLRGFALLWAALRTAACLQYPTQRFCTFVGCFKYSCVSAIPYTTQFMKHRIQSDTVCPPMLSITVTTVRFCNTLHNTVHPVASFTVTTVRFCTTLHNTVQSAPLC